MSQTKMRNSTERLTTARYIPTGFIVAEHAHSGTLVYGVRKTIYFSSPLTVARFAAVIDLHKDSGKETTKTEKLLEAIKKVEPV